MSPTSCRQRQKQIRAVLFDLDGTLIDHLPAIHRCYSYALPKVGIPAPSYEQVRRAIGGGLENAMSNFVPPEKMPEALAHYRKHWDATMLDGANLMPGADELLRHLVAQKIPCAVFTNKVGHSSREICRHLGIAQYFQFILGAKDTHWLKPQIEFTRHALDILKIPAAETALVGDSPWDIQAAKNAGMTSLVVTTGTHSADELAQHKPDAIYPDLPALHAAEFPTS